MVRILLRLLLAACVTLAGALPVAAETPSVKLHVDPDPPPPNESFTLVFEARGDVDADPDFHPLEEDFEILARNQQTSLEIINGRRSRSTVWSLDVLPKHGAPLTVPAVKFGRLATTPRRIEFASGPSAQEKDDGLFLEVDAQPSNPYVQQQVIYRLRLWKRYEISNASLSEPEVTADAIVKPLDADKRYEDTRDGKRYEVIERKFAVFPQASGKVTIKPAVVTAQIVKRGFSLFDNFAQPVATKRIVSRPVELEVRPIPPSFPAGATWLPARQLSLNAEWQPATGEAKVGEPVTRTLSLWADGLTAGQLPPLDGAEIPGVKQYPDRPQTSEQQAPSGYSAVLQRKTALIPTAAGRLALPAIEIPWWNTGTDALEYARVPAHTLEVAAVPGMAPPPSAAPTPAPAAAAPPTVTTPPPPPLPHADDYWPMLAILALVGWALTLALWWRRPGPRRDVPAGTESAAPASTAMASAVEAALARGALPDIAEALLRWAAGRWPSAPPRSLGALAARAPADCAAALWALDAALYRPGAPTPDLARLREAWRGLSRANGASSIRTEDPLPALYAPH
ncbi:MAG TPA: BatD family protein [Gammaproteobacteria bacterium]|nr:BatD family protein [Gammaproteobacteria bacterium]